MRWGDLLEGMTVFDWISPTAAIITDIVRGGSETFLIPQDCGLTDRARQILIQNGIPW